MAGFVVPRVGKLVGGRVLGGPSGGSETSCRFQAGATVTTGQRLMLRMKAAVVDERQRGAQAAACASAEGLWRLTIAGAS
jgi:hypothetical protein